MTRLASLLLIAAVLGCDHVAPAPTLPEVGCWLLDWDGPQPKAAHLQLTGATYPTNPTRLTLVWLDSAGKTDPWWYGGSSDSLYLASDGTQQGPSIRFKRIYTTAPRAAGVTDWSGNVVLIDANHQPTWTANGKLTRQNCPSTDLR